MSTLGLQRSLAARNIPDVLWKILDPAEGPVDPTIRAEVFGRERLEQHGQSLAKTHVARRDSSLRRGPFFPRLRANIQVLRLAHRFIGDQARSGYHVSPAAEWLLDNFHLIEAQLKEILDGLPRRYFRNLPVLVEPPLAGLPRVYGVAWAFVAHTDAAFHEEMLEHFLAAYQRERPLTIGELWALPTTLRVVLVEDLRRLAERLAINKAARELANLVCDRIADWDVGLIDRLTKALRGRGAERPFLVQMSYRLQDRRTAELVPVLDWLNRSLPDVAEARVQQVADQAADNISVSNAIGSLRLIGDADWSEIIERTSPTMQLLLESPMFVAERNDTRDATLHEIEQLARRSGRSELEIAQALIARVKASSDTSTRYWLQGAGRHDFLAELGLHERPVEWWRAIRHRIALPAYLLAQVAGTALLVAWLMQHHESSSQGWLILSAALAVFPASEAIVALVNRMISESTRPRPLPRLALAQGIPAEHRVLVVVPSMITSEAVVRQLAHRLELHFLANPENNAQFALLTDWRDSNTESSPDDEGLLGLAVESIQALNARHRPGNGLPPRFLLLHRRRVFSKTQQRYLGWERKRGKLEQLIDIVAEPGPAHRHQFIDLGELSHIAAGTPYVVTLDADTLLPPGRLRELVGVAAHPQNRPRVDARTRTVVSGYGVLQPKVATLLPSRAETTGYHWLFAGQCGIDPYSAASSEVYQDVFYEGTFTGKGLLHVQAMQATLRGRLPDGEVLSHDLLEGALARCAAVTDVEVIEGAPFHSDVAASRVHRWTRGDWQLLPFIFQPRRYAMRAVNRWKMIDNLRRSLVAPASLGWLLLSLSTGMVDPALAFALVYVAFAGGPLMGAVAGLAPSRDDIAKRHFYAHAGLELLRAACSALWQLAQLLRLAISSVDAISRALYRMVVSRRGLLEWTTAAAAEAAASVDLRRLVRAHAVVPSAALVIGVLIIAAGSPFPRLVAMTMLTWALSPLWTWWASRPRPTHNAAADVPDDREKLRNIARDTWRFFEQCVTAEDNHLPPDNLQVSPQPMLAHRTSPTNIGLYLLSAACAQRFGWITEDEFADRVEATLGTLLRLPRHRGHFLNWYDTQSAAALMPMYVSTVDSGNLSGCLLAVATACHELAKESPANEASVARLNTLAGHCEQLAWEPDFAFLYHRKRKLLHIGFRVGEQTLDASLYDLIASESRLTSLLAIAKGDLPVQHWSALGRPFYAVGTHAALRSWSGSMFEYLMPTLLLHEPHGSVLADANIAAIDEQIAYGRERGVPWGISESAYAGSDHTLAYQYSPQGVPRLALRRTPLDELVIAPYATALATQVAPHRAMANLTRLDTFRMRGRYGYFESLDFTPSRQTGTDRATRVETFMAHHQGMTIVAAANVLLDCAPRRWAMATPGLEAVSTLLHERAPREVSVLLEPPMSPPADAGERRLPGMLRSLVPGSTAVSPTHLLSNGRYAVSLRANGAGCSQWGARAISRSRDDALRDQYGCFVYVRRSGDEAVASITQHPSPDPRAAYRASFQTDRVRFDTAWEDLRSRMTVWVSPEDDVEFREIELHNLGDEVIETDVIVAFEPTLADAKADEAHPAFSNLFLRATWRHRLQALVFERKPRLPTEPSAHAACFIADSEPAIGTPKIEVQRARWMGRNRSASGPAADVTDGAPGVDTVLDTGLDPMCVISLRVRIEPGMAQRVVFGIAAADRAETLDAVIDKYRHPLPIERSSKMSATMTGIRLRELNLGVENFAAIQDLTTALVMTLTRPARSMPDVRVTACDRRTLWRFGISGDRPIVLVGVSAPQAIGAIRALGQALRLWAWGGVACDLVVLNAEPASYQMPLQQNLGSLRDQIASSPNAALMALHVLRDGDLLPIELDTLRALARIDLKADGRPLSYHVDEWLAQHEAPLAQRDDESVSALPIARGRVSSPRRPQGRFMTDGAYRFDVGVFQRPARPWVNVLANPNFGAQISEGGGGYSWGGNSRMNQLTPWSNDPVCDTPGEWFLLEDLPTRNVWSVTPSIGADPSTSYRVTHGQGASRIEHRRGDVNVDATWCVDPGADIKQVRIRLTNRGRRTQRLRLIGLIEWIMGANRAQRATTVTSASEHVLDKATAGEKAIVLSCTQRDGTSGFGLGTAFLALVQGDEEELDWTCDRRELFDERGRLVVRSSFARRAGVGLDPCAALSTTCTLRAGEEWEFVFLLGYASEPQEAIDLAVKGATMAASQRQAHALDHWNEWLSAVVVKTPDPLFDVLVNRWLIYQTVACRMWARAGFYQAGGAFGYRDQLQDAMALAWIAPDRLREQITLNASRQFVEGDVQHWWHAPDGAGVRTHFSDDLLWLPYACSHYVETTGDASVLDDVVPFIEGPAVEAGAEDSYHVPTVSQQTASVYEHAARTIDRSLTRGAHGLPLMGTGDWNDGMNRVGAEGRGESVWLGWFLCKVVDEFAPLAIARGDAARAERWQRAAEGWRKALLTQAWDGQWFKRAFFDDGSPLGSHTNAECQIDLIAQAWAVMTGASPTSMQDAALHALDDRLVDHDAGLLRLLMPPLQNATPTAGYIQAYPPGVRENAGQYSHAGVWALIAQAMRGQADLAYRYFTYLSPAHRSADAKRTAPYEIEPYVMAGDTYSVAPYVGRGGWSWYTGSAAWMHRAALEHIIGMRMRGSMVAFHPNLPSHWDQAEVSLKRGERSFRVVICRPTAHAAIDAATRSGAVSRQRGEVWSWGAADAPALVLVTVEDETQRPPTNAGAAVLPEEVGGLRKVFDSESKQPV